MTTWNQRQSNVTFVDVGDSEYLHLAWRLDANLVHFYPRKIHDGASSFPSKLFSDLMHMYSVSWRCHLQSL